jgi:TonB family protein
LDFAPILERGFELRRNHAAAKPCSMKFPPTKTPALFYFVILIVICPIVVEGKDKDAGAPGNRLTATDVHGVQRTCPVDKPPGWLADTMSQSNVDYPELGVLHHQQGTGIFRMTVDPKNGRVTRVSAVKSTGFRDLDDSAIAALGRWRWKPGTWKETDVVVNFRLGKGSSGSAQAGVFKDPGLTTPPLRSPMSMQGGGGSRY